MPIECPVQFHRQDYEAFQRLDYEVMRLVFQVHNELGKSCDEEIYHNDLAARLNEAGLSPSPVEAPVQVRHGSFVKDYRIDVIAAGQAIYELKKARKVTTAHEGQTMNYLLLTGCEHGKVVAFGGASVDSRFVNNSVPPAERYRFEIESTAWRGPDTLLKAMLHFIEDIGLFLEAPLYNQALVHHFGGEEQSLERRSMHLGDRALGMQTFQMCAPDEAFRITTLGQHTKAQRLSLEKLLSLTDLKAMHWINLNRHQIEFTTLRR
ncbi:GxxExxY protein [Prosthecobacter sp.]|uniref:GxxExxY protein n=1 Tax=Prosthecobacter sp. TaxID=1965333 RepID=UPI0037850A8F